MCCAYQNKGVETHEKAIVPAAILCTVLCIGLGNQTVGEAEPAPATSQPAQTDDMMYVPGFGWMESQGEGTVIYDEMMYENGNKVGSMG